MLKDFLDLSNETGRFTGAKQTIIERSKDVKLEKDRVVTKAEKQVSKLKAWAKKIAYFLSLEDLDLITCDIPPQ